MKHRTAAVLITTALLIGLGGTGEAWGQAKMPRVGILVFGGSTTDDVVRHWFEPFRRTLADRGWIEGKSVAFEFRSARADPSQLAEVAAELVRLRVDVLYATDAPSVRAAYGATRSIPIVAFDFTSNPVATGYVESYSHPARNLTGVFLDAPEFAGKWLELLTAVIPGLSRVVVLWDPSPGAAHLQGVQSVARALRLQLQVLEVRSSDDIGRAFSAFRGRPQALVILPSPMMYKQSEQLAQLALKHRLPATSMFRLFAEGGGAIAYGPDMASATESAALLVAKVLNGAKAGELPVERPTKVQLIVNLKTTKALGLVVPDSVLLRADEVIR